MGMAFKKVPGADELRRSGRVSVDTFKRHAVKLTDKNGVNPHVHDVWKSIVAEFPCEEVRV